MMEAALSKPCAKCGSTKPLDAFPRCDRARDGRGGRCYACARAARKVTDDTRARTAARVRAWKARNPEKVREQKEQERRQAGVLPMAEHLDAQEKQRREKQAAA